MRTQKITGLFCLGLMVLFLSGCYTQFAFVEPQNPGVERSASPVTDSVQYSDSLDISKDSGTSADTVVIRERRDRICIWTRDFWGDPQLRCYDDRDDLDWYLYNNDPWWTSRYYGSTFGYERCPSFYYYDPYTGYCRHRDDWRRCYDCDRRYYYGGYSGRGSSSSSATQQSAPSSAGSSNSRSTGGPGSTSTSQRSGAGTSKTRSIIESRSSSESSSVTRRREGVSHITVIKKNKNENLQKNETQQQPVTDTSRTIEQKPQKRKPVRRR